MFNEQEVVVRVRKEMMGIINALRQKMIYILEKKTQCFQIIVIITVSLYGLRLYGHLNVFQ